MKVGPSSVSRAMRNGHSLGTGLEEGLANQGNGHVPEEISNSAAALGSEELLQALRNAFDLGDLILQIVEDDRSRRCVAADRGTFKKMAKRGPDRRLDLAQCRSKMDRVLYRAGQLST